MFTSLDDGKDVSTVKALFVYNFTKYIEWNQHNLQQKFKIGVMGQSDVKDKLVLILKGKKLYNREIEIIEIKNIDEITGCQILYISKNESDKLKQVVDRFAQSELLIVTEDKNMAAKGSCINIVEKEQKMRFEMNDSAIKKAGLKVANQLYELAIIVR